MNVLRLNYVICLLFFFSGSTIISAQDTYLYKQVYTIKLYLERKLPPAFDETKQYPAIVFYFGGGWLQGDRSQFEKQATYLAQRGMVCFLADYRTKNQHGTTPFDALRDAKTAMRYVRTHARKLGVDPNRIVASGGSAGGHLAAATALIEAYNDKKEDTLISCKPNALVLFNPVIDNGPGGYAYDRIGAAYKSFSPLHNLHAGAPPILLMVGTNDNLIPVITVEYYNLVMQKAGARCDLKLFQDQPHGFFNYPRFEYYKKTLQDTDLFLQSLGYLKPQPIVEIY